MRIACVQMDVAIGRVAENLGRIEERLRRAAAEGVQLAIFPECAVAGYCFDSLDEAREFAEPLPGPSVVQLARACNALGIYAILGMLEADDERVFNACVLVGPRGLMGRYRKVHLPHLGVDRFVTPGDRAFEVFEVGPACRAGPDGPARPAATDEVPSGGRDLRGLRVGMHICYDCAFPEAARAMALQGADLLALPTNWPPGAECMAEHAVATRAMENCVYYAAANRIGTERGFRFLGRSSISDPNGKLLGQASADAEEMIVAEIDPALAREKRIVRVPGKHIIDRFRDRRPEMYGEIVEPKS